MHIISMVSKPMFISAGEVITTLSQLLSAFSSVSVSVELFSVHIV